MLEATPVPSMVVAKTEQEILAEVYANVRKFTRKQLLALKNVNLQLRPEFNGKKFNSVYWIAAHLAWTEDYLLHRALTGIAANIEWLHEYRQSAKPEEAKLFPAYDEIILTLDDLHKKALANIKSLPAEELDKPNHVRDNYLGDTSKRQIIYDAIQHEPMHSGHLSWLMKIHGLQTI